MLVPCVKASMDETTGVFLSGLISTLQASKDDAFFEEIIAREFAHIHPHNPISSISLRDKIWLLALISAYELVRDDKTYMRLEEEITKLASDAKKMADRFEEAGSNHSVLYLLAYQNDCRELAARLRSFATISDWLDDLGKPGHKQKTSAATSLVCCSEFICLRTGSFQDEHFAELLQGRGVSLASRDLSGDAIRKKREHLRKRYPSTYETIRNFVAELA